MGGSFPHPAGCCHFCGLRAISQANQDPATARRSTCTRTCSARRCICRGNVSPFAHVLIGAAHQSIDSGGSLNGFAINPASATSFATAIGVGIDLKVAPFIAVRPIQIDWIHSHTASAQPRIAAGVVLRF